MIMKNNLFVALFLPGSPGACTRDLSIDPPLKESDITAGDHHLHYYYSEMNKPALFLVISFIILIYAPGAPLIINNLT
jgi:hypothetical protein